MDVGHTKLVNGATGTLLGALQAQQHVLLCTLPALQQQWRVGCQPELLLIVSQLELCGHIGLHTQLIFTIAYISVLFHAGHIDCELGCLLQGTVMNIPWLADVLGDGG